MALMRPGTSGRQRPFSVLLMRQFRHRMRLSLPQPFRVLDVGPKAVSSTSISWRLIRPLRQGAGSLPFKSIENVSS
jgi:hypothetical protein